MFVSESKFIYSLLDFSPQMYKSFHTYTYGYKWDNKMTIYFPFLLLLKEDL